MYKNTNMVLKGKNFVGGSTPASSLVDRSRYFNHGVFTGTTWEQLASGLWAMNFESAANLVTITKHKSINNMPQFTFSAWVYYTGAGGGNAGRIFDKIYMSFLVDYASNRLTLIKSFSTTSGNWRTGNNMLVISNWHHIQVAYNSTLTTNDPVICINGISRSVSEAVTPVGTAAIDSSSNLFLGNGAAADRYLNGKIAMPKMWNVIKTAADALKDFEATRAWFGV